MALKVHYQNKKIRLTESKLTRKWLKGVIVEEGFAAGNISYVFTEDVFLRKINKNFLEHDYFTDVITFDLSETKGVKDAEIYISTERVRVNSIEYKTSIRIELLRVMVHGVLHLTGYNDNTESRREEMRLKEDYYLGKAKEEYGISI